MDISPVFYDEEASIKRENPIFFYRYFHNPILMLREGEIVDEMKKKMIELKKEMIDEGGDWYDQ